MGYLTVRLIFFFFQLPVDYLALNGSVISLKIV